MSAVRRDIYIRDPFTDLIKTNLGAEIHQFHSSLPGYQPTPLVSLSNLAKELGVKKVLIKDESNRFGLPSFKVLGASWGACRAIVQKLNLPVNSNLEVLRNKLFSTPLTLVAATDGNHGRAVAFVASLLRISAVILVPAAHDRHVKDAISSEGAEVVEIDGDYDETVQQAAKMADDRRLLIQDTAWEGYEEVPQWIVQGYSTIFQEIGEQDSSVWSKDSLVITPVGVGSLAHGVVQACKSREPMAKVVSVEPDTAACLYENRTREKPIPIKTSFTIMTGMDCGTVSRTVFEDLQRYVDISLTISDYESHLAVRYLKGQGIESGPCGASGVAAAQRLSTEGILNRESTVILLNTESSRAYPIPQQVDNNDSEEK